MVIQGSSFEQIIMERSPRCYITSLLEISTPENKNFEGFYHITAWRPSWSCDPDAVNKLLSPLPKETTHTIFGLMSQAVSEENFFEMTSSKVSLKRCVFFFLAEIWRFNRHVNIEHKPIPKYISYSMIKWRKCTFHCPYQSKSIWRANVVRCSNHETLYMY